MKDEGGWTALYYACFYNKYFCVKYLLDEDGIVNNERKSPLQIVQEKKNFECVKIIENYQEDYMFRVENQSDWWIDLKIGYFNSVQKYYHQYKNLRTDKGESALMITAVFDHRDCVEYLSQFEIGQIDKEGKTALMRAASRNCVGSIPFLMKELKMQDKSGNCALHYACENDCLQATVLLLDECNIKNKDNNSPLQIAVENNCDECRIILKFQYEFKQNSLTEDDWFLASKHGIIYIIKHMIQQFKQKTDSSNSSALMIAVINNHKSVVELLSQYECGIVDNEGNSALIHSAINNHFDFIQYLNSEMMIQNSNGWNALHYACKNGYIECVKYLLNEHSLITNDGKTPIQIAQLHNNQRCVEIIEIFYRNSLTIQNIIDWFIAATCGNLNAIKQVVSLYNQTKNDNQQTSLIIAVLNNHKNVVEFLSQYECGIVDSDGKTALHHALNNSYYECAQYLLCEYNVPDRNGFTPLQIAIQNRQHKCICIIFEHVAKYSDLQYRIQNAVLHEKQIMSQISEQICLYRRQIQLENDLDEQLTTEFEIELNRIKELIQNVKLEIANCLDQRKRVDELFQVRRVEE